MNQNDLTKLLKPLVKKLVKEAMQEELSTVISEIIKQTGKSVVESKQQTSVVNEDLRKERIAEKQKVSDERRKMLENISKNAYGGINIFEGTTPIASAGNPEQRVNEAKAGDPLADSDPSDPGVSIDGLLRMTGGWKQIK
jgi:oligoendopeptidase F